MMIGYNANQLLLLQCEFTDFDDEDNLLLEIFSENIFRPNGTPEQNILTPSMLNIHECDILLLGKGFVCICFCCSKINLSHSVLKSMI